MNGSNYRVNDEIKRVFNDLLQDEQVQQGLEFIKRDQPRCIEEQKEIVRIEAPTFHEHERARHYAERIQDLRLYDVQIDRHGNVVGRLPGVGDGPTILIEAHLDTVFPFGTDVTPVEKDGKIYAPGICDDTRGLAANLSVIRAFNEAGVKPEGDIIFAGTVCEEGMGGLGGMKALLEDNGYIDATISIDGPGRDRIVYEATGIRNFEVSYTGPGGHAYGDFGLPSPVHAASRAVTQLSDLRPPETPKTTFTVSLIEGGHAIHGIAQQANFKINMRSDDPHELDKLEQQAISCFEAGATEENKRWGQDYIKVEYEKILDVPAGTQPTDSTIVQAAWKAIESVGVTPRLKRGGCTNTNMPINMGIPAVTLGRGGKEGGVHTLNEWFDPEGVYKTPQKSFLLLLALAGLHQVSEPLILSRRG